MNERQKQLLQILLTEYEHSHLIQELADRLHCSEKTVRNDLTEINLYLEKISNGSIRRKPGIGVLLDMEETERMKVLGTLLSVSSIPVSGERIVEIAFQLLTSHHPITIQNLVDRYYVAKTIVRKDLEAIKQWLERFELVLETKPRLGHMVRGSEIKKRYALSRLSQLTSTHDRNYVLDLFSPYEITTVRKALRDLRMNSRLSFTDEAMESLLVHALIMLKRTRQQSSVFVPQEEKEDVFEREEYQFATTFFKQLEDTFRLSFPVDERVYFTWHLVSAKVTENDAKDKFEADEYLKGVVFHLIEKLSLLTQFPFKNDPVLKSGLMVHMLSVINRMKYGFPITNPMLADIKKMYPFMFSMVVLTLSEIKQTHHLDINEDEAAYLVLHFQASIERMEGAKKALIVCHMGVGMSHLLEAKIAQSYKGIQVVACVGKAEVDDLLNREEVDFVISTVPLEDMTVPYILISPLLESKDKEKLSQFVDELDVMLAQKDSNSSLSKLLTEDVFFLKLEKEHRYEIVELLGNALMDKGYVKSEFTHSALLRERESATSIGGGIAIPHANPKFVNKSAIGVATMKQPIEWGSEFVSVVFLLAIAPKDQKITRDVISKIATISENPVTGRELAHAQNMDMFLELLSK